MEAKQWPSSFLQPHPAQFPLPMCHGSRSAACLGLARPPHCSEQPLSTAPVCRAFMVTRPGQSLNLANLGSFPAPYSQPMGSGCFGIHTCTPAPFPLPAASPTPRSLIVPAPAHPTQGASLFFPVWDLPAAEEDG